MSSPICTHTHTHTHTCAHTHTHTHTHDNVYIYSLTQIAHFDITLSMLQFVTDSVFYHYLPLNRSKKLGLCLLSNTCMSLGLQVMFTAELAGPGVQWDTIGTAPTTSDNLHLGHVTAMLAVDTVLYMIIAWYIGVYGVAHPPIHTCTHVNLRLVWKCNAPLPHYIVHNISAFLSRV